MNTQVSKEVSKHINIAKHVWRTLRSVVALSAAAVWLYSDHTTLVFVLLTATALIDQFKGYICAYTEKLLGWKVDFDWWG